MSFVFVEETGNPIGDDTPATRRRIRSQARLNATKEKRDPVHSVGVSGPRSHRRIYPKRKEKSQDGKSSNHELTPLCPSPSLQGYERTKIQFDFDILNLSGLTSVHLGAGSSLSILEPRIEQWVLLERSPSYLDFVPAYYESSALVKTAVDCIIAQYRHALLLDKRASKILVFLLYDKALKALQDTLNDPKRCLSGETMLAISILQLYDVRMTCNKF